MKGFSLYPSLRFINKLIKESKRQKEKRQNLKDGTQNICISNKEAANVLKSFNWKQQGRPLIETEQPTIVKLVQNQKLRTNVEEQSASVV